MIARKFKWSAVDSGGVAVCLVMTVAAAYLGFAPIYHRHATYLEQVGALQSKKQGNAAQELTLKAAEKDLAHTEDQLNQIPLHLQPAARVNQRLAAMTDLAARYNLKIEDIAPGSITRGKRYDAVNIHLAGEGAYPSCAAFLHELKQTMPDIGSEDLHLASEGSADATAKFTFDLQWFAASGADVATAQ